MPRLEIPYSPRYPQTEIHPQLEAHRFCVLVTHRQMGKTVCAVNHLLKKACTVARPNGRYFYVAPFLKQAEILVWDYFKRFTAPFTAVPLSGGRITNLLQINEAKLSLRLPNSAVIRVLGADNPDALRGTYADGVVLDEYAQIKPEILDLLDADKLGRLVAEKLSLTEMMLDEDKVSAVRQERADAQQNAAEIEQAQSAADISQKLAAAGKQTTGLDFRGGY